ncbi:protein translocase subunit SecD [Patescibacteria group bacterium]|nr:protein translocase subunit SecD [Patescibacteria group bacterium]
MKTVSTVSKTSTQRRALGLLLLGVLATVYILPQPMNWVIRTAGSVLGYDWSDKQSSKSFVLGLDLQGGSRLEYEADVSKIPLAERQEALNGVRDVIERRINALGVAEPVIQTTQAGDAWRVSVELAGVSNVQEAIKKIGETPILEFKEESVEPARELTLDEATRIRVENEAAKAKAEALLQAARAPGASFLNVAKEAQPSITTLPSVFLREDLARKEEYLALRGEAVGVAPRVIETADAYLVANIEEKKVVTKEAKGHHILISWKGIEGIASDLTKEEAKATIDGLRATVTPQTFVELAKTRSMEPYASSTSGELDWTEESPLETDPNAQRFVPEFAGPFFALAKGAISDVVETPFGYHIIYKTDERSVEDVRAQVVRFEKLTKEDILPPADGWKATALTGKQLASARVDFDPQTGAVVVALQFNDEGRELFSQITRANIGKRVGIFIDGQLISAPVVQSEIPGGQAVITGSGSLEEARELARSLQAGALPVPVELIAQQTIGPSLGADSLAASLRAGLIGFAFVALFLLLVYRVPGLVAVAALTLYAILSLAIFKYIPVTLTLAGIAGFILSLGIAVDANILAFERFREELALGKSIPTALEEAFTRAWPSIRDGHVTVLISCALLYWFSSSVIRGFSLTLAIGILLSLFTAVVTCRVWLRFLAKTALTRWEWLFLKSRELSKN